MKTVSFLRLAIRDLNEIVDYIAKDDLKTVLEFSDSLEKEISRLATTPYLGKSIIISPFLKKVYRLMVFEPYLVFYAIEMDSIRIHRIIHEKRSFIGLL